MPPATCHPPGFTLIELLVVMVILGILGSFVFANVFNGLPKARDAQRKSDLKQLQTALQLYYQDNNTYPDPTTTPHKCNSNNDACWPNLLGENNPYIKTMPKDPLNNHLYYYCRDTSDNSKYTLVANLENTQDNEKTDNTNNCSPSGLNWYVKTNP